MFKIENIVKGILLTIFGFVVMAMSVYGWWEDMLTNFEALVVLCVGFALAFMRTKLDDLVTAFFQKLLGTKKSDNRENHQ